AGLPVEDRGLRQESHLAAVDSAALKSVLEKPGQINETPFRTAEVGAETSPAERVEEDVVGRLEVDTGVEGGIESEGRQQRREIRDYAVGSAQFSVDVEKAGPSGAERSQQGIRLSDLERGDLHRTQGGLFFLHGLKGSGQALPLTHRSRQVSGK